MLALQSADGMQQVLGASHAARSQRVPLAALGARPQPAALMQQPASCAGRGSCRRLGWVGFDPFAAARTRRYVRIAVSARYRDAQPVTGSARAPSTSEISVVQSPGTRLTRNLPRPPRRPAVSAATRDARPAQPNRAALHAHPRRAASHHHHRYDRPINLGPQIVRLRPAPHCRTPIVFDDGRARAALHQLAAGSVLELSRAAGVSGRTRTLRGHDRPRAEMSVYNPFDFFLEASAEQYPFSYDDALKTELAPYLACDAQTAAPLFRAYLDGVDRTPVGTVNFLVALNQQLAGRHRLSGADGAGRADARADARARIGLVSRQRMAAGAAAAPSRLAARFVSGYLIQLTPT
jgi:hypothetical protein